MNIDDMIPLSEAVNQFSPPLTTRWLRILIKKGRIPGAVFKNGWLIPRTFTILDSPLGTVGRPVVRNRVETPAPRMVSPAENDPAPKAQRRPKTPAKADHPWKAGMPKPPATKSPTTKTAGLFGTTPTKKGEKK